jgi:hypothetical protein
MERGKDNRRALKKATVRRGLNTIRAAMNHAVQTCSDLRAYKVPRSPLTKKSEAERDRALSDEEISKISGALGRTLGFHDSVISEKEDNQKVNLTIS